MTLAPALVPRPAVLLAAWTAAVCPVIADTLLSTDFTARTVSGRTASNIPWASAGVQPPGNLTWINAGAGPTNTPLFDTPDAQGHFAPDLNIDTEGPWSVSIPLQPVTSPLLLTDAVLTWRHFNNAGAFQTASRTANWTVSVTGPLSAPLGSATVSNVSGLNGVTTLPFTPPITLNPGASYALTILVTGTTVGNNTGLDALAINGTPGTTPAAPIFPLSITPTADGIDLGWPSRPGMIYHVRSSTDLAGPPAGWPELRSGLIPTPPANTEPLPLSGPQRFYVVEETPAPPLNILLLLADDWRHDTLGCAGNPVVQTPSLDLLADEGVRFTQACVTTSVCWVSRASIYTGQWMSRHGRTTTGASITNWSETFPGLLRSRGYWVGHVGKWHNGTLPAANYDFARSYHGAHWYTINGTPTHVTQRNENDALEFLRNRPANKPFLLTVATFAPHAEDGNALQYLPQPETNSLYTDLTIPVPVNATEDSFQRLPPFLATAQNEGRIRWFWRFDTPEKYQSMMKNYYRLCTGVDTMCGRVLAELQAQGILENTLVIFCGDNGYFHAEHGLADKWYPFQESIRVPLIIRDPRLAAPGRGATHDAYALNVDLAPTILAAAGIAAPAAMQGRDLTPLYLATAPPAWRTEFFYEHPTITSITRIPSSQALVRRDWKYLYWPDYTTEQLFGLETDPLEEDNRSTDPAQATRLAELRSRFNTLKAAAQ